MISGARPRAAWPSSRVSRFVIARILNHADDSITAVYDTYSYAKEKREALELWSRKVHELVTSEPGSEQAA